MRFNFIYLSSITLVFIMAFQIFGFALNHFTKYEIMGASGWSYFVPYEQDLQSAFIKLKQKVFEAGDYYDPYKINNASFESTFSETIPQLSQQQLNELKKSFEYSQEKNKRMSEIKVHTIEELLIKNAESGTHSILDIRSISETDNLYSSGKVSDKDLMKMFSTVKPTKEMVLAKEGELQTYRGRWNCTYVIVFEGDAPSEIYFTGYSGD